MIWTDNQIIQVFLPIINQGLADDGFINVTVKQANQPTMQGINTNPTVYFYKLTNKRYGFLGRYNEWDSLAQDMIYDESQWYESTWRVQALVLQNPKTPNQYTASDLVNEVASIMMSQSTVTQLISQNIGLLRVENVANPYFWDDRDNFEASPSFDFTLTYENIRAKSSPIISEFNASIYGV